MDRMVLGMIFIVGFMKHIRKPPAGGTPGRRQTADADADRKAKPRAPALTAVPEGRIFVRFSIDRKKQSRYNTSRC